MSKGDYDKSDNFSVTIQPALTTLTLPSLPGVRVGGGSVPDLSYLSANCLYPSQKMHALSKMDTHVLLRRNLQYLLISQWPNTCGTTCSSLTTGNPTLSLRATRKTAFLSSALHIHGLFSRPTTTPRRGVRSCRVQGLRLRPRRQTGRLSRRDEPTTVKNNCVT